METKSDMEGNNLIVKAVSPQSGLFGDKIFRHMQYYLSSVHLYNIYVCVYI